MAYTPNEEQKLFLDSSNSNVLVSASAGSGKTSTMIQKLMQIILNEHVSVKKLLVLTFTDAAATEIKQKLFNQITEALKTVDQKDKEFLNSQLDLINSAEIGTLHSVCKKLIIKYFYEINESPDFRMLSDKESKFLLENSVSSVFEKHIADSDDRFFELYDSYNSKRNEQNLKKIILIMINYLRNKADEKDWIERTKSSFDLNLNTNPVCDYLWHYSVKMISIRLSQFMDYAQEIGSSDLIKYYEFLSHRIQDMLRLTESKSFEQFIKILGSLETLTKPRKDKNASVFELDVDEKVDQLNKDYLELIKQIKSSLISFDFDEIKQNLLASKDNLELLLQLCFESLEKYKQEKNKKNANDFNDLEDKMLKLLENPKIENILKDTYQFVFFDEYQDINEKQEKIVSKLTSDDNYYMIGDVKQSIYAFRQSSPKIFVSKFYKFSNDGIKNKVINFNKNYRSDKNILEFNNLIFDKLITENTIGINYSQNSRFESDKKVDKCVVDMQIINSSTGDDETLESVELEKKEAIVVANKIAELRTIKKQDGTYYDFKDIAIIVRSRGTFVGKLFNTLSAMQIPVNAVISSDFYNSFEIKLCVACVRIMSSLKDEISLAVVLKHLFDLTDLQLISIKNYSNCSNFCDAIANYDNNDEIAVKLHAFFEFVDNMRMYLNSHTISEFLNKVLNDFSLMTKIKSMPNGNERIAKINELLSLADGENYRYNIDKFIDFIDFVSVDNELQKVGTGGNAVQIMTIHYSKGLEFPAVIFCGLGKKFNINKDTNDIIINDNFGFGLKYTNSDRALQDTILRNACKIDNKKSELNEEIRLLYVAMTRPKERLSLIGQYNLDNFEKNAVSQVYNAKNYFDMIFKAIPKVYYSNFLSSKDFVCCEDLDSKFDIKFLSAQDIVDDSSVGNEPVIIQNADLELKKIFENNSKALPNFETFTIKNTVTNILNEQKDYENLNYVPHALSPEDKIESRDFLKIGTAYHSVMQNLNFDENKAQISDLIDRLVRENVIDQVSATQIDIDSICKAIEVLSPIVLNADKKYTEKQFIMQENYNKIVKNSDNNTKVIVQGIIDLVVVKDGKVCLIDYKTNRTKDEMYLKKTYALQLEIYKQAFEKATNTQVDKKYLYSFYLGKLIEID